MNLEKIKKFLLPYLEEKNYTLYSMKFVTEYGMKILQIIIDKENGITVDELAVVNEFISERIDDEVSDSNYMLEVSSRGAERELELSELNDCIGEYVMVKSEEETYGYLIETSEDFITLEVNEKGRIRKKQIDKKKINKIRLNVKF